MNKKGLLIVVSGPSGAGKGKVLGCLSEKYSNLRYSVSVTTRAPRDGEIDGVDYFFKTKEQFEQMRLNNEFLEYKIVFDNCYGTPLAYVKENLDKGYDVVLEIDTEGALDVKNSFPDAVMIFITAQSRSTIEKRLRERSTESEEQIQIRTQGAIREIKQSIFYDYIVVNEQVEQCAGDIVTIINAEKFKVKNNKQIITNLIYGGK